MPHADLTTLLAHAERAFGTSEAVVEGERRVTYGELARRVRARAAGWQALGVRPGERVTILERNTIPFLESCPLDGDEQAVGWARHERS